MRKRFEQWGAGLSEEDFACALAAFGVIGAKVTPSNTSGVFDWLFDPKLFSLSAADLAKTWRTFRAGFSGSVSIHLDPEVLSLAGVDPGWLRRRLSNRAVQAIIRVGPSRTRRVPVGERKFGAPSRGKTYSILDEPIEEYHSVSSSLPGSPPAPRPRRKTRVKRRPRKPENRRLYAQIIGLSYPERQKLIIGGLRPGKSYSARIGVGLPGPDRKDVGKPIPDLGDDPNGHRLTVIFWEPRVCPVPEVKTLLLPPKGDSDTVDFRFQAPVDAESIAARVTILHANRVLQTGLLKAPVGTGVEWAFELDAAPRTRLEGLSGRTEFDIALVLNHDDEGTARATVTADGKAVVIPISEGSVNGLTRALSDQISKIAAAPERYETLQSTGTEELLLTLAQKGGGIHRSLSRLFKLDKLTQPETPGRPPSIHLTSALPDSFFPAELLYRFQVPEDTARLCKHAVTGLAAGACPPECPTDKSGTVCPLGFWGLCCVIERHSYLGEHEKPAAGFHLRPEPFQQRDQLEISGKALLAASDVASKHEEGAVRSLLQKLRGRGPAELVSSWKEWSARLEADRPTLLVLLPHHERKGSFEILEIGDSDPLKSELIQDIKHVRISDEDKPIVLLMGCDTNLSRIAFDNFVTRFITEGAAIVVSTIATILGRHASPATARLIELLDEEAREGKSTFGEVMLRLRQSLFMEQTPMALGLTAYGDADWVLTRKD